MATYAIGDVQGCLVALKRLVDRIAFDPNQDRLWFVGDLVNRGPDSLGVLRFAKSLGKAAITVLGNHDLHALALAHNIIPHRPKDTLTELLSAPDREELFDWLRHRPLMYLENNHALLHAGLLPQWTLAEARELASEVEEVLRSDNVQLFLRALYEHDGFASHWDESLTGLARLRMITRVLTRMRVCSPDGRMELTYKGPPDQSPKGFIPWFQISHRKSTDGVIVCGHWSALGVHLDENLVALDSGCVWGGALSAIRLENRQVFQVTCRKFEPKVS